MSQVEKEIREQPEALGLDPDPPRGLSKVTETR
jgi:hypothetical protein